MLRTLNLSLPLILLMAILAAPRAAEAQNAAVETLQALETKYADLKSVAGTFTQERKDKTFGKTFTEPASFRLLKPSHFRVDYQGAEPSTVLISGKKSYNYVPKLKQAQVYTFKGERNIRDLNYLLLGFGAKTDDVLAVYNVQPLPSGKGVRLTPKDKSQAQFKYITMELNGEMLPVRFTMEQTDGSVLAVNVNTGSLQMNPSLGERDFQPDFPRGTNMVDMQ